MKLIWNNKQIERLHGSSETPKIWLWQWNNRNIWKLNNEKFFKFEYIM